MTLMHKCTCAMSSTYKMPDLSPVSFQLSTDRVWCHSHNISTSLPVAFVFSLGFVRRREDSLLRRHSAFFGTGVRLVTQIYALLPRSRFVYLAYCHLRPVPHTPDTCTRVAAPQVCLLACSVFYHLVVWAWCHSKQPALIDPTTSWECITLKHTDIVGEKKKTEWDLDLLTDRKWEPSNPEKYINLEPLKANKHHLKYLSAFFKNQSQTKTRLISFSGSSFTCRMHCWMSPAGMWTRPWCWQSSQSCRLFAVSQSMFLCLKSRLVGWILHASGETGGVLLAKAREQVCRLKRKLQQEGKFFCANERERQPGRREIFRAQKGLFQKDVDERWFLMVRNHPMLWKTSLIPVPSCKCQKVIFCIFYFLKFS